MNRNGWPSAGVSEVCTVFQRDAAQTEFHISDGCCKGWFWEFQFKLKACPGTDAPIVRWDLALKIKMKKKFLKQEEKKGKEMRNGIFVFRVWERKRAIISVLAAINNTSGMLHQPLHVHGNILSVPCVMPRCTLHYYRLLQECTINHSVMRSNVM